MARRVALCADDYGYNEAVDQAILVLADQGRLGGVSCMVDAPRFADAAPALREREAKLELGLHFNLTESFAGAPRVAALPALVPMAWLHMLGKTDIMQRLRRQLAKFEAAFKRMPSYIDGHQHVHQFPVIRDALLQELDSRYGARRPLIRNTGSKGTDLKSRTLAELGGNAMKETLLLLAWPTNLDFVGAYRYAPGADFGALAAGWIRTLRDGAIWMCHPAARAEPGDPIGAFRVAEFKWLSSPSFDPERLPASIELVRPNGLRRGPV